jgi:hypothetical protein
VCSLNVNIQTHAPRRFLVKRGNSNIDFSGQTHHPHFRVLSDWGRRFARFYVAQAKD